jgi:hypothetical protein
MYSAEMDEAIDGDLLCEVYGLRAKVIVPAVDSSGRFRQPRVQLPDCFAPRLIGLPTGRVSDATCARTAPNAGLLREGRANWAAQEPADFASLAGSMVLAPRPGPANLLRSRASAERSHRKAAVCSWIITALGTASRRSLRAAGFSLSGSYSPTR